MENKTRKPRRSHDQIVIDRIRDNSMYDDFKEPGKWFPVHFEDDEYFGFTDLYRIFACKENFGYEEMKDPFKFDANFKPMSYGRFNDLYWVNVTKAELKEHMKQSKAEGWKDDKSHRSYMKHRPISFITAKGKVIFNVDYLFDLLDFCGDGGFWIEDGATVWRNPAYSCNPESGKIALCLPTNYRD